MDRVLTLAHFPVEAWIDFVRNLGTEPVRLEMQRHRATCQACHRLSLLVEDLAATVNFDRAFGAPADVVERALRLFDKAPSAPAVSAPAARKTLDLRMPGGPSPASPVPARRLFFLADGVALTLDIERGQSVDRICVTGRLTESLTGLMLDASLSIGGDAQGAALLENRLAGRGEFFIECRRGAAVLLHVHVSPPLGPFDVHFDADL